MSILDLAALSPSGRWLAGFTSEWDEDEILCGRTFEIRATEDDRVVERRPEALESTSGPLALAWIDDGTLLVARPGPARTMELTLRRRPLLDVLQTLDVPIYTYGSVRLSLAANGTRVVLSGLSAKLGETWVSQWISIALPHLRVEAVVTIPGHHVRGLAISPDGQHLLVQTSDRLLVRPDPTGGSSQKGRAPAGPDRR